MTYDSELDQATAGLPRWHSPSCTCEQCAERREIEAEHGVEGDWDDERFDERINGGPTR